MCGINGVLFYREQAVEKNIGLIETMNRKIHHRGPDDSGIFADEFAAVGMTRLSIIDLKNGKQPIANEDGTLKIVFNGEVYNYRELRDSLKSKGHLFSTDSDTETVLHAYEEYGGRCVEHMKGMFAFAIYNEREHSLFLARDRMGEKPLYYANRDGFFIFASELKSIFSTRLFAPEISKLALARYLTLTYIPAPLSILEGVYKLEAGHWIKVSATGEVTERCYWDIVYDKKEQIGDYQTCKKELRHAVFHAVEKCMVADVPLGAFMSGGIDSTIIAGIMSQASPTPIDTFTIGFKDKAYDESELAKIAAKHFGARHHIEYIDYSDMLSVMDEIIRNMDEPFADASMIPTYLVSKIAQKNVKTVLTGDAGDELFGGYEKYLIGYYSRLYNKVPKWLRDNVVEKCVYRLPDKNAFTRKLRKVISNAKADEFVQRRNLMCLGIRPEELSGLLCYEQEDVFGQISARYAQYHEMADELDCTFYTDEKIVLEGDMLTKVDRMSMLNSLETRVPLLYPNVVELSARIPADFKISGGNKKKILKDTFSDMLPDRILKAPKRGFGVPLAKWMRDEMKEDLVNTLDEARIRGQGLLHYEVIRQAVDEHMEMKKDHSSFLWAVFLFEKWYTNYFEAYQ